jgi:peptidoglycan-associated lipoprotein
MTRIGPIGPGFRLALAVVAALAVSACASKPNNATGVGLGAAGTGYGGAGGVAGAALPGSAQDFVVNVGDRVFFETDSTQLTDVARQTLDRQAQWLGMYPRYTITLEGHADERGTREYNIALGAKRAATARDYLAARGVAASRVHTISYGKERPVAVCNDISCWSQNRRAVTVIENAGT